MSELPSESSNGLNKNSALPTLPLDLRCNVVNGRRPTSPTHRGYAVTVSRRCAPPVVPANTAPSTSLPRGGSSSIVTTTKVNRRHSTNSETASASTAVGMPRKRSRDAASSASVPIAPNPPEKLTRVSLQAPGHAGGTQQTGVKSVVSVEDVTSDGRSAVAVASDGHLSSASLSVQHQATVALTAVAGETAASNTVSLPVVLTSVNGMLVPLSSAPAAIIVVNCATTTSPPSSQTSGRLCPIAPAPPPVTKQSEPSTAESSAASLPSTDSDVTSSSSVAQRRTYRCEEPGCGKTYFKNSHLKVHRRVHTGLSMEFVCLYYNCHWCIFMPPPPLGSSEALFLCRLSLCPCVRP